MAEGVFGHSDAEIGIGSFSYANRPHGRAGSA